MRTWRDVRGPGARRAALRRLERVVAGLLRVSIACMCRLRSCIAYTTLCVIGLAAQPAFASPPTFASVTPGRTLVFPSDTGAHPAFRIEWWYVTGWLDTPEGKPLGFQITFFRSATGHDRDDPSAFAPTQLIIAHAALSDPSYGKGVNDQKIAREGFGLAYAKPGDTNVKLDNWTMLRTADGHYAVHANANGFALNLSLTPTQPPLLEGDQGFSQKGPLPDEASYYYSEPQLQVSGTVVRPVRSPAAATAADGKTPVHGVAWLDHEWSSTLLSPDAAGWDWLGANLDDGSALMAFKVRGRNGHTVWTHAAMRDAHGKLITFDPAQVDFVPLKTWRSPRTDTVYPVAETVKTGPLSWQLEPLFDDQELDARNSSGTAYWEGAVSIIRNGNTVGRGYLELTGYEKPLTLQNPAKAAR
jgi:predicted secreted hydrolase